MPKPKPPQPRRQPQTERKPRQRPRLLDDDDDEEGESEQDWDAGGPAGSTSSSCLRKPGRSQDLPALLPHELDLIPYAAFLHALTPYRPLIFVSVRVR
jgi:hypothetical protein